MVWKEFNILGMAIAVTAPVGKSSPVDRCLEPNRDRTFHRDRNGISLKKLGPGWDRENTGTGMESALKNWDRGGIAESTGIA